VATPQKATQAESAPTEAAGEQLPLLTKVINKLRPLLDRSVPVRERILIFWSVVAESRDLAALDRVESDFRDLAIEVGLVADLGRNGADDLEHVLQWGLHGFNPFEEKGRPQ
jgi:hypothetical protein